LLYIHGVKPLSSPGTSCSKRVLCDMSAGKSRVARKPLGNFGVTTITLLPVVLTFRFWMSAVHAGVPRSFDGSGHLGISRIYDAAIFPDTFGWTKAYFCGMPFPNYYPPLFYWLVSALHKLGMGIDSALKLMVFVPVLLMPAAVWTFTRAATGRQNAANAAAVLSLIPMLVPEFHGGWASGLNYFDTFVVGLYTEPLAFLFLLAWCTTWLDVSKAGRLRIVASSVLLACTLLTNIFVGITALLLAIGTLAFGLFVTDTVRAGRRKILLLRAASCGGAGLLVLFWYGPMLGSYSYVVTRPLPMLTGHFTPWMVLWYGSAALAAIFCLTHRERRTFALLAGLAVLTVVVALPADCAPAWFPMQGTRLAGCLSLLATIPFAVALDISTSGFHKWLRTRIGMDGWHRPVRVAGMAAISIAVLGAAWLISRRTSPRLMMTYWSDTAFYPSADAKPVAFPGDVKAWMSRHPAWLSEALVSARDHFGATSGAKALEGVLEFGKSHRDGRYMVENPSIFDQRFPAYDGAAMTAYLGSQGNETLTGLFREAAATSLFANPQDNALSVDSDLFGISSALGADLDFASQPLTQHLRRCRELGVRYLVAWSDRIKNALAQNSGVKLCFQREGWSLYAISDAPLPLGEVLRYLPTLVVSPFTLKQRRSEELNFTRLEEQQFFDGWFDVILAHSSASSIDRMTNLDRFGSLVLVEYPCKDCEEAYRMLRTFAQRRTVIAIRADQQLFHRLEMHRDELPGLSILDYGSGPGKPIDSFFGPSVHYANSPSRALWTEIRQILDRSKIPVTVPAEDPQVRIGTDQISVAMPRLSFPVPLYLRVAAHSRWMGSDGSETYTAGPMMMLTFVSGPAKLTFARSGLDRVCGGISAMALVSAVLLCVIPSRSVRSNSKVALRRVS